MAVGLWITRFGPEFSTAAKSGDRLGRAFLIMPGVIDLDALLARHDGVLLAREHRGLKSSISRWWHAGRLARLLPGTYVAPSAGEEFETRLRAVSARIPDAVIAGAAAARLTLWPKEQVREIDVLVRSRRVPKAGFRFIRRQPAPEQVTDRAGIGVVSPALLAVDSAAVDNGARIDDLLRAHWPLERIEAALQSTPGRTGNRTRRRVVQRSRTLPWSQAERRLHDLLDRHHITGWTANLPVTAGGREYWLDAGFEAERVAIEVDGYEFHSSRSAFEYDRGRANDLVGEDWRLLKVTWLMLEDEDRLLSWILGVVRRRRRRRSSASARAVGRCRPDGS
jgi:very-short-patch-repair endonuclease